MQDETAAGYPIAMRAVAVLGLLALAGLVFILLDVASGGKLTGAGECDGCGEAAAGA
jgi:hypothetical protein